MPKPIVAIVGRPNVGKSTLVNRLAEARDAIVHESRGVTRDRSYHTTDWNGRSFVLVDTGGIESIKSTDSFAPRIREQALAACDEADVIIFVVDGSVGVTDEDEEVARILRKGDKPVFLMGDFNSRPDSEAIKSLKEDFAILSDETQPTWPAKKPDRTIDFIMLDKAHSASYKKLGGGVEAFPDATDHCAIWVDVAAAPAP